MPYYLSIEQIEIILVILTALKQEELSVIYCQRVRKNFLLSFQPLC